MWGNITGAVGAAISKVQKLQNELESQLDQAVGADGAEVKSNVVPPVASILSKAATPESATLDSMINKSVSDASFFTEVPSTAAANIPNVSQTVQQSNSMERMEDVDLTSSKAETMLSVKSEDQLSTKSKSSVTSKGVTTPGKSSKPSAARLEMERQLAEKANEINRQTQIIETKSIENAKLMGDLEKLRADSGSKDQKFEAATQSLALSLQESNESSMKQINKLKAELNAKDAELSQVLAASQNTQSEQVADLTHKLKTQTAEQEKQHKVHGNIVLALKQKLEEVTTQNATLQSELDSTRKTLTKRTDELTISQKHLSESRALLESSSKQITELNQTVAQLQQQLADGSTAATISLADVGDGKIENNESDVRVQTPSFTPVVDNTALILLQQQLEQATHEVDTLNKAVDEMKSTISELETTLTITRKEFQISSDNLVTKTAEHMKLSSDLTKTQEALSNRERALETATKQLSELHRLRDENTKLITDLKAEISEKDLNIRKFQSSLADESELHKQVNKLLEQAKERDDRLQAFESEGQKLAKKDSEMRQLLKQANNDSKEKENEIKKLKQSKEQLTKVLEEQQEVIRKHESDVANSSKNLSAMQAVSFASTEKLTRLESEIATKVEEIASQRRALENSWNEANELKRTIAELKADRDDLRRQIGEGTSKVMETESYRRDIEQKEAVLRATSKQLQDSLQRQMHDSSIREERLREEVNEMRKRWQDAISSREGMASELGNATAPLLRQISSLQEQIRIKSENWQNIESSLSERALRAENVAEVAEHKRSVFEEQLQTLKQKVSTTTYQLNEVTQTLTETESALENLRKEKSTFLEEKKELESRLSYETLQRQNHASTLRELEMRHKIEINDLTETLNLQITHKDFEISKLRKDLTALTATHQATNLASFSTVTSPTHANGQSHSPFSGRNSNNATSIDTADDSNEHGGVMVDISLDGGGGGGGRNSPPGPSMMTMMPGNLSNGETSFAGAEKIQQRNQMRNDEIRGLQNQIQQLQASRNALLDEVNYLSAHNAELEERAASVPQLRADLKENSSRVEMLLIMLGEKEEELEGLISDMKDVKQMYRAHLDELLEKVVSSSSSSVADNAPHQ